jgi:hypothetical protein
VAGYSFGGWVAAGAAATEALDDAPLYLISPPVAFIPFDEDAPPPRLSAVVTGTRDSIAPLPQVRKLLKRWGAEHILEVLEGCDHFYWGCLPMLAKALASRIPATDGRGARPPAP